MKSERKAGDPIEGEPEDGVQDDTPPSTDQPDAPASLFNLLALKLIDSLICVFCSCRSAPI